LILLLTVLEGLTDYFCFTFVLNGCISRQRWNALHATIPFWDENFYTISCK